MRRPDGITLELQMCSSLWLLGSFSTVVSAANYNLLIQTVVREVAHLAFVYHIPVTALHPAVSSGSLSYILLVLETPEM
jgi:hypothetical protein